MARDAHRSSKRAIREASTMRIIEAAAVVPGEGPRIKVVLIDEGLGNLRTKNYYGPEAIASAVKAFEGKPCFFDHPSESESADIPERRTRSQCGYFKGLHVEKMKVAGRSRAVESCVGEIHFDLSDDGRKAYEKACTALHFQKEFPNSKLQYVGWSVLGDGDGDKGVVMKIGTDMLESDIGDEMEVNYVTSFTEGESCDMVTRAARGGRALAVAESDGSSRIISREDSMDLKAKLIALIGRLTESVKKATDEGKKDIEESIKQSKALLAAVEAAPPFDDDTEEAYEAMCAKREGEDDAAHKSRLEAFSKVLAKHLAPAEAKEPGDEDDPEKQESHRRVKSVALSASDLKRNRIAVLHVMQESSLPEKAYSEEKIARLARLPFEEAERTIKADAQFAEAVLASAEEPVANLGGRVREGGGGDRTSVFAEAFNQEA